MVIQESVWLAVDYHFPTTYSCRVPMSSASSVLAMPAPGPATVRLAMIRAAIELFGVEYVRDELFPIIRSAEVYIKPPAKIAISTQLFTGYKANLDDRLIDSLMYREICHAEGTLTVYIKIPTTHEMICRETLAAIGYWGQANSLAWCMNITHKVPKIEDCGRPLKSCLTPGSIQRLFSCIASEFRGADVEWDEITPVLKENETTAIRLEVWVWPLVIFEQQSNHKLLVDYSFTSTIKSS